PFDSGGGARMAKGKTPPRHAIEIRFAAGRAVEADVSDQDIFLRHELRMPRRVNKDRKSTRLNSSHLVISYAVFCLQKSTQHTPNNTLHERTATGHNALLCDSHIA